MKKIFSFLAISVLLTGNINAISLERGDLFDDCLDEAEADYEITGSLESAIDYYNNCIDEGLAEIKGKI
ncbi:hypothetical protein [Siansivirga zeaxanthinifaciens]|uniref:Uncharacterized protein n=1 Tax=Siansivirga zeaxanthinifaciens CC-SAMT-1 TaxID=1454006 RepID=A0A0C5WPF8_9FLAO|nr:hypothetical protein [Siansivirga zeaxanthinifaciens]AJR04780.1 hypothetical protein AW14_04300 [Siansivirga zeaxanthinifaciens CC-SAMT-1]